MYKCHLCGQHFLTEHRAKTHHGMMHLGKEPMISHVDAVPATVCPLCGKTFGTVVGQLIHWRRCRLKPIIQSLQGPGRPKKRELRPATESQILERCKDAKSSSS